MISGPMPSPTPPASTPSTPAPTQGATPRGDSSRPAWMRCRTTREHHGVTASSTRLRLGATRIARRPHRGRRLRDTQCPTKATARRRSAELSHPQGVTRPRVELIPRGRLSATRHYRSTTPAPCARTRRRVETRWRSCNPFRLAISPGRALSRDALAVSVRAFLFCFRFPFFIFFLSRTSTISCLVGRLRRARDCGAGGGPTIHQIPRSHICPSSFPPTRGSLVPAADLPALPPFPPSLVRCVLPRRHCPVHLFLPSPRCASPLSYPVGGLVPRSFLPLRSSRACV